MAAVVWKRFKAKRRYTPRDDKRYIIAEEVIAFTVDILQQYGARDAEGLVYYAGRIENNIWHVTAAVAPRTDASRQNIHTDHLSNAAYVEWICDNDLLHIGQAHSHPGTWVDHSKTDDRETAFRTEGLLSVVVPCYGSDGMEPLDMNGMHRFDTGKFIRLSKKYINAHFTTLNLSNCLLKDQRNES